VTSHTASVVRKIPLQGEALWETVRAAVEKPWRAAEDGSTSAHSSLVIFDWDDTLLPTAALVAAGRIAPAPGATPAASKTGAASAAMLNEWELDSLLESCAEAAIQALQVAAKYGRVIIVTNSGYGWVNETASRFCPQLLSVIEDIPVISARSIFEPLGVVEPWKWKVACFQRIANCVQFDPLGITGPSSLISIGDGWHERVAAIMTAQELKLPCHVKCLKLLEQPGVEQLVQQLELCSQVFEGLAAHPSWVEACYSVTDAWGLQLEARAADPQALSGSLAGSALLQKQGVETTLEVGHSGAAESPEVEVSDCLDFETAKTPASVDKAVKAKCAGGVRRRLRRTLRKVQPQRGLEADDSLEKRCLRLVSKRRQQRLAACDGRCRKTVGVMGRSWFHARRKQTLTRALKTARK